ncbi:MAG: hypothetical protein ACRC44_08560 [Bifidobacterium asteroides]
MREPSLSADITERLRYHIELLAASGYPAKLQRDALAEILTLREALARSEADSKGEGAGGSTG